VPLLFDPFGLPAEHHLELEDHGVVVIGVEGRVYDILKSGWSLSVGVSWTAAVAAAGRRSPLLPVRFRSAQQGVLGSAPG